MKRTVIPNSFRKPRSDSYHAQLTQEQRAQLYEWLCQPGKSLKEAVRLAPPWRIGRHAGKPPGEQAVGKIGHEVRVKTALAEIESNVAFYKAALSKMLPNFEPGSLHEEMLNGIMEKIFQEVAHKTMEEMDPGGRTDAARLLLKRGDQFLDQKKFELLVRKYEDEVRALQLKEEQDGEGKNRPRGVPTEVLQEIQKELRLL